MSRRHIPGMAPAKRWALEDEELNPPAPTEGETSEAPAEPAADSLETSLLEVQDSGADIEADQTDIEDTMEEVEALESLALSVKAAKEAGGYDQHGARAMNHALESIYRRCGVDYTDGSILSMESFGGSGKKQDQTGLALENINVKIKEIWEKIIAAVMKSIAWVKEHFAKVFDAAARMENRAKALASRAGSTSGTAKEKTIKNASIATAIQYNGTAANAITAVARLTSIATDVFDGMQTKLDNTGEQIAKALEAGADSGTGGAGSAFASLLAKPSGYTDVNDPATAGVESPGDGVATAVSPELPGGRAIVIMYPMKSSGEDLMARVARSGSRLGKFPGSKAAGDTLTVLSTSDAAKIASEVEKIAGAVLKYRANVAKMEAVKKRIAAGAKKMIDAASKETDADKTASMNKLRTLAGAAPRLLDQPAASFSGYALQTGKAFLDLVELSLKQYEAPKKAAKETPAAAPAAAAAA